MRETQLFLHSHLAKELGGHFSKDAVEVHLVCFIDETVMERALSLVTKQSEDMGLLADNTRICLKNACSNKQHTVTVTTVQHHETTICNVCMATPTSCSPTETLRDASNYVAGQPKPGSH